MFPNDKWFSMYDVQTCPDGSIVRNTSDGPYGQQLLLNYCFGHPGSTIVLCPVSQRINVCVFIDAQWSCSLNFKIEIVQKSILSMGQASTISITTRRERISEFNGQKTALRIIRKNLCTDNQRIALRLPLIMWPRGTLPRAKNCF